MESYEAAKLLVETLIKISRLKFGGKENGRYRLSIKEIEILSRKRVVYEDFLRQVATEAAQKGWLFARLDTTNWLFMRIGQLSAYRKLTKDIAEANKIDVSDKQERKVVSNG